MAPLAGLVMVTVGGTGSNLTTTVEVPTLPAASVDVKVSVLTPGTSTITGAPV